MPREIPTVDSETKRFSEATEQAIIDALIPFMPEGTPGPSGTITGASASPLSSGAAPTVTLGGTPEARTLAFGIPAGPQGPVGTFAGTSTTSLTIGTGDKTLTTQAGLALSVGQFVRLASTASPGSYMAGTITAYSSTSMTVAVVETAGSGTYTAWGIAATGTKGIQGIQGNVGGFAELAYAESIVQFEVLAGTSTQDVTGVSISFVMPSRPVYLKIGGVARYPFTGTAGVVRVVETTAANATVFDKFVGNSAANTDWTDIEASRRITGTAGVTRSFKMQAVQRAGNAWTIAGNTAYPQWLGAFSA